MPNGLLDVPDWFLWENQGAGVTLADLSGNGGLDLVVFTIDNVPGGPNRGLYRFGRGLTPEETVSDGWSEWTDVRDWFISANQGARSPLPI